MRHRDLSVLSARLLPGLPGLLTLVLLAVTASACGGSIDYPPWELEFPPDTPVREYPAVGDEERAASGLEIVDDLVIGEALDDPGRAFYQVRGVAADDDGNIYVLEGGNHRVQVFDAEGSFLFTFGQEGQGPGELENPRAVAVVGDRVVVADRSRIGVWSLAGEPLGEHPYGSSRDRIFQIEAVPGDDRLIALSSFIETTDAGGPKAEMVARAMDPEGRVLAEYGSVPVRVFMSGQPRPAPVPSPYPIIAASVDGLAFKSPGSEYQMLALGEGGDPIWALRVAWERRLISEEMIEEGLARSRERDPSLTRGDFVWPDPMLLPAVRYLATDGRGRLWVFPYTDATADEIPANVYDADGNRVAAGTVRYFNWSWAQDDLVYGRVLSDATGEEIVVRRRIVIDGQ